ncbi:MAG TPA: glycosyltransferase, partial [Candidatus Saccharimonadales bacterium]|nr:glycosyltransferase [Candidatus Saccharimonadales bacterium]
DIHNNRNNLKVLSFLKKFISGSAFWTKQIILSSIIIGILIFIVVNFYIFSSIVNLNSFFYAFLLLSLLTDGLFIFIHLPRRSQKKQKLYFNPKKMTVLISSYNGEDVIEATIKDAAKHVPLDQIVVMSDASTDRTAEVARAAGARVYVNEKNLHKVRSLNAGLKHVKTPYVLIMDDDTLIGETFLPTSLLDDGYTAVSFNVMPLPQRTLVNELQRFEYRATMQISKNLRSRTGAIGNISGAIGLYRTDDLKDQITRHSGQFAGEDEQRTLLAHMYSKGKGITYTDSLVLTQPPATYRELFRQRAFSWSIAAPELFMLYWRVLLSPRYHYLLKAEKAYLIYIFLTEPLRILFAWALILKPTHFLTAYTFYVGLNIIIWMRLGYKDTLRSVILSPIYTLFLTICRFIGYFYWLKVKAGYLRNRLHRHAPDRKLLLEYAVVLAVIVGSWAVSIQHFRDDMHLFNKIRSENLTNNENAFNYDSTPSNNASLVASAPTTDKTIAVFVEPGDNLRALAHKAIAKYLAEHALSPLADDKQWVADQWLMTKLPSMTIYPPNTVMPVPEDYVVQALATSEKFTPEEVMHD